MIPAETDDRPSIGHIKREIINAMHRTGEGREIDPVLAVLEIHDDVGAVARDEDKEVAASRSMRPDLTSVAPHMIGRVGTTDQGVIPAARIVQQATAVAEKLAYA